MGIGNQPVLRGRNEMKWEGQRLSITKFILRPSTTTNTLPPSGGFMLNCLEVQLQARGQTDSAFPPPSKKLVLLKIIIIIKKRKQPHHLIRGKKIAIHPSSMSQSRLFFPLILFFDGGFGMMVWLLAGHVTCRFLASTSIFPLQVGCEAYRNGDSAVVASMSTRNTLVPSLI